MYTRETEKRSVYNVQFVHPDEQSLRLRNETVLEGNIKIKVMDKCIEWVQLAQDGIQWQAPGNTVIYLDTV